MSYHIFRKFTAICIYYGMHSRQRTTNYWCYI